MDLGKDQIRKRDNYVILIYPYKVIDYSNWEW